MVGNGVTNWKYDTAPALGATLGGFDMIPPEWIDHWDQAICNFDALKRNITGDDFQFCTDIWDKMNAQIPKVLNPYDLYRTVPDEE